MFRGKIILALLFALMVNCFFVQADVLNKWVTNEENVTLGDTKYGVQTTEDVLVLREINGLGKVVMPVNTTKIYDNYFFSNTGVKNSLSDYLEKHNISGIHGSGEETNTFMHKLQVKRVDSQVKIKKELNPSKPYLFDEVEVIYSIENTGNMDLQGLVYREDIPVWLEPVKYTLPERDNEEKYFSDKRKIKWTFNVDEGETKKLRGVFNIVGVPDENQVFKLKKGTVTYEALGESVKVWGDEKEVEVVSPFDMEYSGDYEGVTYGENFDFDLSFINEHNDLDLRVQRANISFCEHLHLEDIPSGATKIKDNHYYLGNTKLEPGESSNSGFELKSTALQECEVKTDVEYSVKGGKFSRMSQINVTTATKEPGMDFDINPIKGKLRGGQKVNISFMAENKNEFGLDKAIIEFYSEVFNKEKFIFLNVDAEREIENNIITYVSSLDENQKEHVHMDLTLVSESGSRDDYHLKKRFSFLKGLSDNVLDLNSEVINVTNGTYATKVNIMKLAKGKLNNFSIEVRTNDIRKTFAFSGKHLKDFEDPGAQITKLANLTFKNSSLNNTNRYVNLSVTGFVEERSFSHEDSFVVNGTNAIGLSEVDDKTEKKTEENPGNGPIKKEEKTYAVFNLGKYITIGFVVLGLMVTVFLYFNRDSSVTSKHRSEINPNQAGISDYMEGKSKNNLGLNFDNLKNDKPSNEDATMKQVDSAPDSNSDVSVLETYINNRLSNGDNKDKIRKDLKKKGWLDDILDVFLK